MPLSGRLILIKQVKQQTTRTHTGRLTWNLNTKIIFQTVIFRLYVNLRGCNTTVKTRCYQISPPSHHITTGQRTPTPRSISTVWESWSCSLPSVGKNYLSHKVTALTNSIGWSNQFWVSLCVFFAPVVLSCSMRFRSATLIEIPRELGYRERNSNEFPHVPCSTPCGVSHAKKSKSNNWWPRLFVKSRPEIVVSQFWGSDSKQSRVNFWKKMEALKLLNVRAQASITPRGSKAGGGKTSITPRGSKAGGVVKFHSWQFCWWPFWGG